MFVLKVLLVGTSLLSFDAVIGQQASPDKNCVETEECVDEFLVGYDTVRCYGFDSCVYNVLDVELNAVCSGLNSCYGAIIDSKDKAECSGSGGCTMGIVDTYNDAYCDGTQACMGSIVDTTNGFVHCGGNVGCAAYSDPWISTLIDSATDVFCSGRFSCYNALNTIASGDIHNNNGPSSDYSITCSGDYSCSSVMDSSLFITYKLVCNGRAACMESQFENIDEIHVTGAYGLYKGSISISDGNSANIYLQGWYAGLEASITCSGSGSCNVYCSGNGCNSATLNCQTDDPDDCQSHCDNIDCPTKTLFSSQLNVDHEPKQYLTRSEQMKLISDKINEKKSNWFEQRNKKIQNSDIDKINIEVADINDKMMIEIQQYEDRANKEIELSVNGIESNKNTEDKVLSLNLGLFKYMNNVSFSSIVILISVVAVLSYCIYSVCKNNDANDSEYKLVN